MTTRAEVEGRFGLTIPQSEGRAASIVPCVVVEVLRRAFHGTRRVRGPSARSGEEEKINCHVSSSPFLLASVQITIDELRRLLSTLGSSNGGRAGLPTHPTSTRVPLWGLDRRRVELRLLRRGVLHACAPHAANSRPPAADAGVGPGRKQFPRAVATSAPGACRGRGQGGVQAACARIL